MGKKEEDLVDSSKHSEQIEYINYNSEEEHFLDGEDEYDKEDEENDRQFYITSEITNSMIKYIDDNSLPLGSLLNQNNIENFILSILQ
jgi:hypothetical protein